MDQPVTLWTRTNPIASAQSSVSDVKNTFSSWDACMAHSYCKWPVIIAIVIVSLIVASILFCVIRCVCCGLECCCGCFSCLNSCCSCCQPRGRRGRDHKYRDEASDYRGGGGGGFGGGNPYGGYQPQPQPVYVNVQAPAPQRYEPNRQYASYDSQPTRSVGAHDDALPAMPTWKNAESHRISHEEEEVEMDHLNQAQSQQASLLAAQARAPSSAPTASAQTPGGGLYADNPAHAHDTGDLGDGYGQPVGQYGHPAGNAAFAGAAGAAAGAGAGAAASYYGHQQQQQGYTSPPPQQHGYVSPPPQQRAIVSPPPAMGGYGVPQQAPAHTASPPPPSYHTAGPISPTATGASGLPASLTPGGQQSGVAPTASPPPQQSYQSYSAYQPQGHPAPGSWHNV